MNKIVASLLCYSLTIPLFVNAVSSSTPSSKRYKRSDLAQSSFDDEPKPSRRVPERKKTPTRQQQKSPSTKTAPLKRTASSSRPQAMIAASDDEELFSKQLLPWSFSNKRSNIRFFCAMLPINWSKISIIAPLARSKNCRYIVFTKLIKLKFHPAMSVGAITITFRPSWVDS